MVSVGIMASIYSKTFKELMIIMAYSFHNQNMSTLSNVLVIHTALDKDKLIIDGTLDIECNY